MTHTNHIQNSQPSGTVEPPALETCLPSADEAWALEQLRASMRPPMPAPQAALDLLTVAARSSNGGGQAARHFLFWLAGRPDPTGYIGNGGLELRRLDRAHKAAAMDVLAWWAGPTQSDQPLYDALSDVRAHLVHSSDASSKTDGGVLKKQLAAAVVSHSRD